MSEVIEDKVVQMRFDNKQFEENIATSMSTLDKLKHSLKFTGATKGLEELDAATKKVDFSQIENAACQAGFSFRDVWLKVATVFEYQIARRITNAATNMIKALTIDPIKTGFSEYETQINAVQTILANTESKGKTLDDVSAALDELNAYADKTIYNFTEMTRNIGTFTAAGVDLDTSVSAIKGIANLAAVSGSTSQQASTAMYQLSQAMASGTVKLMDWNSVVNAGMGGQVFQDALKETAKVHGVAIDDIIKKQGSFRESLSEGWLTTEILTETLSKFTGDLTEDQLKQMGYTDEQIKGIVKMGKTANDAATKVKTFTQLFDTLKEAAQSGWTQTWEIIVGDFEEAKEVLTKVSDVIGEMIGNSAEARNEMLENWKALGGRDDLIESISNAFKGLMSIVKPIKEALSEIFPPLTAEQLAAFTSGLKSLTEKFTLSDTASENLKRTFKGLFAVVDIVRQVFVAVVKAGASLFGTVGDLAGGILGVTGTIGDWIVALADAIRESDILNKTFQGVADIIKAAFKGIKAFAGFIKDGIVSPGLELFHSLIEKIGGSMSGLSDVAGSMKDGIIKAFDAVGSFLENCSFYKVLSAVWKGITIIASGIAKAFGTLTSGLAKAMGNLDFNKFMDILGGLITGGIVVKIIKFFKGISDPIEDLKGTFDDALENISGILDGVRGSLEGFQTKLKADALNKIAVAIAILAAALVVLSLIEEGKLSSALGAITIMFLELSGALAVISKIDKGTGMIKMASTMTVLASAMLILAVALKILSSISPMQMAVSLVAIAVGLGALLGAVNLLPESKVNKAAKAIRTMSTALLILSVALKIMSTMSWSEMAVGLVAMAVGLAALVGAVNLLPKDTAMKTAGLVGLSVALVILAGALKIMATISWGELAIGLVALAGSLVIILAAMKLMTSALPGALAMLIIAPALVILAGALKIMASMSWEDVAIGLVALAGSLAILAAAMFAMSYAIPGALALLIVTPALMGLTAVLTVLGMLSWESVIKGLVALAGAFTIIGAAGYLLGPVVPVIVSLAGAIALIGAGILAAGIGLTAFGAGLSAVAIGFTAIVASLSAVVTGVIALVAAVVTGIIKGVGDGIVALCNVIADSGSAIMGAVKTIIVSVCNAITESVPAISECLCVLLDVLLDIIMKYVPKIVDLGIKLIIALLDGIASKIGAVMNSATKVIIAFLKGVSSMVGKVVKAAMDIMLDFINGLADGIREYTPKIIEAVNNLMSSVFEAIGMAIGNVPQLGKQIIQGLIKGIKAGAGDLWDTVMGVVKSAWDSVLDFFGIASPSRLAAEAGRYIDEGLAVGLKKYADVAGNAAEGVGKTTMNTLNDAISGISDGINGNMDLQPTIRPVLDLSDIKNGSRTINGMLGFGPSMDVLANVGAISSSMKQRSQNGVTGELVSEITKLRKDLANSDRATYNINGITYDDGSNISTAVKTLVRAAKVDRRL